MYSLLVFGTVYAEMKNTNARNIFKNYTQQLTNKCSTKSNRMCSLRIPDSQNKQFQGEFQNQNELKICMQYQQRIKIEKN